MTDKEHIQCEIDRLNDMLHDIARKTAELSQHREAILGLRYQLECELALLRGKP